MWSCIAALVPEQQAHVTACALQKWQRTCKLYVLCLVCYLLQVVAEMREGANERTAERLRVAGVAPDSCQCGPCVLGRDPRLQLDEQQAAEVVEMLLQTLFCYMRAAARAYGIDNWPGARADGAPARQARDRPALLWAALLSHVQNLCHAQAQAHSHGIALHCPLQMLSKTGTWPGAMLQTAPSATATITSRWCCPARACARPSGGGTLCCPSWLRQR